MPSWIPLAKVETVIQPELWFLCLAMALSSWVFYRVFLKALSAERHRNLRALFRNLLIHCVNATVLCMAFWALRLMNEPSVAVTRLLPYIGIATVFWGCTVLVKTSRIVAFEYLFLTSMRAGVPLLIVNLLTLMLSLLLGFWVLSGIFGFNLAPLLATSAIFSIVLGLALQDTLGNLIAGVALQFDKPYEIGDWIEVTSGNNKWVGQVHEITWRATLLVATTDERITVPNRVMAQSEVANFSTPDRPFIRSHIFKMPYSAPRERVKQALLSAVARVPAVKAYPPPLVFITEPGESWVNYKLIYYIDDYGRQFITGDEVLTEALTALEGVGLATAPPRLHVITTKSEPA